MAATNAKRRKEGPGERRSATVRSGHFHLGIRVEHRHTAALKDLLEGRFTRRTLNRTWSADLQIGVGQCQQLADLESGAPPAVQSLGAFRLSGLGGGGELAKEFGAREWGTKKYFVFPRWGLSRGKES